MKKLLLVLVCLLWAAPILAQNPPVLATWRFAWEMPSNIPTVAIATTFEPRFVDGTTPMAATPGMTCATAVPPATGITCQVAVGQANATALNALGAHSVTVALFRADLGLGVASAPLSRPTPAGVPTGLRLIPQ